MNFYKISTLVKCSQFRLCRFNQFVPLVSTRTFSTFHRDKEDVKKDSPKSNKNVSPLFQIGMTVTGFALAFASIYKLYKKEKAKDAKRAQSVVKTAKCQKEATPISAGQRKQELPNYRRAEITNHKTKETGIWVTFNEGVYDITEFSEGHPGGDKILLAAGGPLEPFWEMYGIHKNEAVFEILEELRIGNTHPDDKEQMYKPSGNDPYRNDPTRHPALKVNAEKPFNAETPVELLADNFLTPNELFFVRNHLPVPEIDMKSFKLEISSATGKHEPLNLTVEKLKKDFKPATITATIQCAGNRRSHMAKSKAVKGLAWGTGAISNAEWTGVLLADVLQKAGVTEDNARHIIFQGLDKDLEGSAYEASVPVETALDPRREVLLAYAMNGKPIPRDHGYPLRVIVPGTVGARQVKWLSKVIASDKESDSHWQQNDYKTFSPSIDYDSADFCKAVAIQDYPIQSAICLPKPDSTLESSEEVTVRGYALSGGGRGILRVEVSADGGRTWHEAALHSAPQRMHRQWAWTLYEATIKLPKGIKEVEVVCKAVDNSHNQQPQEAESIWNMRGLIHNAWHRVKVHVPQDE